MSGEQYNKEYYQSGNYASVPYEEPTHWIEFFGNIADHIVEELKPTTVLDAGCAMGYLVAALRDRGVEAYGLDISEYAVSKVREDIRPYCFVGSLTEPLPNGLPRHYDLIVTIEVLEHLIEEDGIKAINNLTSLSEQILFSSTPDDTVDPTHVNVQPREYWARLFAEQGFCDDLTYRPLYVTAYALFFRKGLELYKSLEDYERFIGKSDAAARKQLTEIETLKIASARQREQQNAQEQTIQKQQARIEKLKEQNGSLGVGLEQQRARIEQLEAQNGSLSESMEQQRARIVQLEKEKDYFRESFDIISNSSCWKITKPIRVFLDWLKTTPLFLLIIKLLKCVKENGLVYTCRKIQIKLRGNRDYEKNYMQMEKNAWAGQRQRSKVPEDIKFSILVPLYNTPEQFLRELIRSVQAQDYQNWELCLADGSDDAHADVETICQEYAKTDSRILYRHLEKNAGISANTNACAQMASGDYLALLDHDDLLAANALSANAQAVYETDADVLYSDEDHLSAQGKYINPFFKPDWSPDLLNCQMYICHFLVFRRTIFEKVGGFQSAFDGSQDYDLMLRMSEETDKICHIPEILYHWRESQTSTAAGTGAKPYAHEAGRNALSAHLKRVYGEAAKACDGEYTFTYDVRFSMPARPKASIIIPMRDKWNLTDQCIRSIVENSSYQEYEILVLDNRSAEIDTFSWFDEIQRYDARVKVVRADMEFNWSSINNFGVEQSSGDVLIFLNNDTLVISEDWIERLAENALRKEIGAVGALLLYPDDTIQHAGVVVGFGGWADHVFKGMAPIHYSSPFVSPVLSRNVLAVTGACMAISREHFMDIGPFDEGFIICGSDVEFCLRAHQKGYFNLYNARVRLCHLESKSRDSFIPEVDFQKSYEAYGPYRENGDPFYNINLDMDSTTPKVKFADMKKMNLKNYKSFIKEIPFARAAYAAVRELTPTVNYRIPEVEPINCRKARLPVARRLNLLIPSLDEKHVFGGIATALRFYEALQAACGCPARIIITDAAFSNKTSKASKQYVEVSPDTESEADFQIIPFADRTNRTIPVAEGDIFLATGWWTAYTIRETILWQKKTYDCDNPLLYMVQDYEPGFYPWSSRYLMAESTYHFEFPTYAIINSGLLRDYLENHNCRFAKSWYFEPVLNPVLKKYLPLEGEIKKKKQILVYGRPGTERNAFSLLVYALKKWAQDCPDASQWTILSAGEECGNIALGKGAVMRSVGKLTLDAYAKTLKDSYAGISLMVSPHPSYPPMEMATFGIRTITNCYENKDLSAFSDSIISLRTASPASIATALCQLCEQFSGKGYVTYDKAYVEGSGEFGQIPEELAAIMKNSF